MFLNKH